MRFFKIPFNTDLSNTSVRYSKIINGVLYIEYNEGYVDESWVELSESEILEIAPNWFENETEPTEEELLQAEMLLNQAEIIAKQNEQDEVLAEILLNQMGV